jgi:hypothetical protein
LRPPPSCIRFPDLTETPTMTRRCADSRIPATSDHAPFQSPATNIGANPFPKSGPSHDMSQQPITPTWIDAQRTQSAMGRVKTRGRASAPPPSAAAAR